MIKIHAAVTKCAATVPAVMVSVMMVCLVLSSARRLRIVTVDGDLCYECCASCSVVWRLQIYMNALRYSPSAIIAMACPYGILVILMSL